MKLRGFNINSRKLNRIKRRIKHLPQGKFLIKYLSNKAKYIYLMMIKSTKVAYPTSIILEVTNHCNLRCTICPLQYNFGQNMDKGLLNLEKTLKIIDEIFPYVDSIGLTGLGETLIHKNLLTILQYIKSKNKGIQTSMSTNAHVPNGHEYLLKLIPYLDQVQISIDGVNDIYDKIRIEGNFETFKQNVITYKSICDAQGVPLMFNFTITKENYHHMPEVLKLAEDIGIQYLNMNPLNITAVTTQDISYYNFFYSASYKEMLSKTIQKSKGLKNVTLSLYDYTTKNGFKKCIYPWIHNYVSWDGYMVPCCARPFPKELHFGNVFEQGVLNSLNSP